MPRIADNGVKNILLKTMPIGIITFIFILHLAFLNKNYHWDAISFAMAIEEGSSKELFHPHHLIYNPMGFIFFKVLRLLNISIPAMLLMQIINAIFGSLGILIVYRILLKLSIDWLSPIIFALLLGFSYGYWHYSIENEVYIIPILFLLIILYLMLKNFLENTPLRWGHMSILGILTSLACLFHQMHIFFIFVIFAFVIIRVKDNWQRAKLLSFCLLPFPFLLAGPYILAAYLTGNLTSPTSFFLWLTSYAHKFGGQGLLRGLFRIENLFWGMAAISRTFFYASPIRNFLHGSNLEIGMGVLFGGILLAFGILFYLGIRAIKYISSKTVPGVVRKFSRVLITWILIYGVFAYWWEPYNVEFWIPILVPTWILLFIGGLQKLGTLRKTVTSSILLILFFLVNFIGEIAPDSRISNNGTYLFALRLSGLGVNSSDLILTDNVEILPYYKYFFKEELRMYPLARSLSGRKQQLGEVYGLIKKRLQQGGRVFVSASKHTFEIPAFSHFYKRYQLYKVSHYPYMGQEIPLFEIRPLPTLKNGTTGSKTLALVTNFSDGTVSIIDVLNKIVDSIIQVGYGPWGVAITPDGTTALVACSDNKIYLIDVVHCTVIGTISGGKEPEEVAITPDGRIALVAYPEKGSRLAPKWPEKIIIKLAGKIGNIINGDKPATGMVSFIDIDTKTNIYNLPVRNPHRIDITPDGSLALITDRLQNTYLIDIVGRNVIGTLPVGKGPEGVAITPDGRLALVSSLDRYVYFIDLAKRTVIAKISGGEGPEGMAITPDGRLAFLTITPKNLYLIDIVTRNMVDDIQVGLGPTDVAVTPDGNLALVANKFSNTVSIVNIASRNIIATVGVGRNPTAVAILRRP